MILLYVTGTQIRQGGQPTKKDVQRVREGALRIFRYDNNGIIEKTGMFQELNNEGRWIKVPPCRVLVANHEVWHE